MKKLIQCLLMTSLSLSFATPTVFAEELIILDGEPMDDLPDDVGCSTPYEFFYLCSEGRIFSKKVIMYKDGQLFAKTKFKNKNIKVAIYIPRVQHKKTRGRVSGIGDYSDATFKFMMKFLAKPHSVQTLENEPSIGNHIPVAIFNTAGQSLDSLIMRVQDREARN